MAASLSTAALIGEPSTSIDVTHGATPMQLDVGFMTSVDPSPVNVSLLTALSTAPEASSSTEGQTELSPAETAARQKANEYLASRARNATQHLLNSIFSLPVTRHPDVGPLATLPPILYSSRLSEPREKPLPPAGSSKALTKWEQFAKAKGIQHRKKERMTYDEERGEWVARWGYKGKNQDEENQWIHEMPANAEEGYNPAAAAKKARKERKAVNEGKRLKNLQRAGASASAAAASAPATSADADPKAARAAQRDIRKAQLAGDILRSKRSTASMGRFDRELPAETAKGSGGGKKGSSSSIGQKLHQGLKRKFDAGESTQELGAERERQLGVLRRVERGDVSATSSSAMKKASKAGGDDVVNVRKAVKFASKGNGSFALAQQQQQGGAKGKAGKGKRR